jgi:hypothetical protein
MPHVRDTPTRSDHVQCALCASGSGLGLGRTPGCNFFQTLFDLIQMNLNGLNFVETQVNLGKL